MDQDHCPIQRGDRSCRPAEEDRRILNGFLILVVAGSFTNWRRFAHLDPMGCESRRRVQPMRILLVEDEPRLLRSLGRALREEGYAVDMAEAGDEGLYKAENSDYDAIVLDIMLPKLDGWEVLARLRKQKQTPVLMLTARDGVRNRVRGLDIGADDYLVKPFDLPELMARLRALIRRSAGAARSSIELGDLAIDTRARTVSREGEPVALTAREFAILEYLALHRGEVVSRSELYEHLFDENDDTLSNLLDVHVFSIRRKLGRDIITTHRGQGYSVEP
jgi:two-component system, OmpR family, response regulator